MPHCKDKIPDIDMLGPLGIDPSLGMFRIGDFQDNLKKSPIRTKLHRHQFHELSFFFTGTGVYAADFGRYEINAPMVVITPRGTVHGWPERERLEGVTVAFDFDFLLVKSHTAPASVLYTAGAPPTIPLEKFDSVDWRYIVSRIHGEYQSLAEGHIDLIRAYMNILLIELRRLQQSQHQNLTVSAASLRIYEAFMQELELADGYKASPKTISKRLNVSPDHLSFCLKEVCGHNASYLINERILLESKRLLAHSHLSVAEVGYELGHEDPSYFARFFKRHLQMTPREFRQKFQRKEA